MRIITRTRITDYCAKHPTAKPALTSWLDKSERAHWTCFADIKETFNSVDSVGNQHYVFNIGGNNHRLIVVIKFIPGLVYVRFIGTHEEYNKIDARTI